MLRRISRIREHFFLLKNVSNAICIMAEDMQWHEFHQAAVKKY